MNTFLCVCAVFFFNQNPVCPGRFEPSFRFFEIISYLVNSPVAAGHIILRKTVCRSRLLFIIVSTRSQKKEPPRSRPDEISALTQNSFPIEGWRICWILFVIAERLKKVRSFIGSIQLKNCSRLFADITGIGVEFPQKTDFMNTSER